MNNEITSYEFQHRDVTYRVIQDIEGTWRTEILEGNSEWRWGWDFIPEHLVSSFIEAVTRATLSGFLLTVLAENEPFGFDGWCATAGSPDPGNVYQNTETGLEIKFIDPEKLAYLGKSTGGTPQAASFRIEDLVSDKWRLKPKNDENSSEMELT